MKSEDLARMLPDAVIEATSVPQRRLLLIECAKNNDMTGLQKLVTAEPGLVKRAGEDALAAACSAGHLDVVQRLHTLGVRIDGFLFDDSNPAVTISQYPLHCAFEKGQWHVARWLIDQGAKVMHMPRLLANMVDKAPELFRHMLKELPYISAYETPVGMRATFDEKMLADGMSAALDAIISGDNAAYAAIAVQEGLSSRQLYAQAMHGDAYDILRDLYASGYRPDAALLKAHCALLENADGGSTAANVRALVQAFMHADNHVQLDGATLQDCRRALQSDFAAGGTSPAALTLTRGGYFLQDVAPLLPQAGIALLLLEDTYGATLADALVTRGELLHVFNPAVWKGDFTQASALCRQLPDALRAQVDLAAVKASFTRYHIGKGEARFKFPAPGKRGPQ